MAKSGEMWEKYNLFFWEVSSLLLPVIADGSLILKKA
jgi:hypothetical protein